MTKLEFLSFSLPYGLKCQVTDLGKTQIAEMHAVYFNGTCSFCDTVESDKGFSSIKPILRPLSDLIEPCLENGETPILSLTQNFQKYSNKIDLIQPHNVRVFPFIDIIKLIKWHFDIAGLIDSHEAVDYHTLSDSVF